jgi:flagellin-like hook-associated protein FlgL
MSDINLSGAVRRNLLSLQNTAELLGRTQERLATGNKVNSALDNPTNFFTASALNSRASDIGRLLDSVANGVQTLKAADTGIKSLTKLVENAQATARQALQAPKGEYEYKKASLLGDVGLGADVSAKAQGTGFVAADVSVARGTTALSVAADTEAAATSTKSGVLGTTTLASLGIVDGDSFTIDIEGAGALEVSFGDGAGGAGAGDLDLDPAADTVQDLIDAVNGDAAFDGVTMSLVDGKLTVTSDTLESYFTIAAGAQDGLDALGLVANDYAASNPALQGLVAAGETLTINGTAAATITFGTDVAGGEVSTVEGLIDAINAETATTDITASLGDDGELILTGVDDTEFTLEGDAAISSLGLKATSELESSTLTALEDKKFTIAVNGGTTIEFTLGAKAGQISSQEELAERLQEISGIDDATTVFANGLLTISSEDTDGKFRVGGDDDVLEALGIERKTFSASNPDLADLAGRSIEVSVGSQRKTITFGDDAGVGQVNSIAELKGVLEEIGAELTTETTAEGETVLSITTSDENAAKNITISDESDQYALSRLGLESGVAEAEVTAIIDPNSRRASLESDFNDLLKQIDSLARDASYNGVNLLDGDDLTVIFNETGKSRLDVTGTKFNAEGLGLLSVVQNDFQDDNKINAMMTNIGSALETLRSQASKFGSQLSVVETRQSFTKELINVLETGAANLTLADLNEEGANLTALQTRQSLSTTALSLAAQSEQNVLQLIR